PSVQHLRPAREGQLQPAGLPAAAGHAADRRRPRRRRLGRAAALRPGRTLDSGPRVPPMSTPESPRPAGRPRPPQTDAAMSFKGTYWLFAVLLLVVAAFVVFPLFRGGKAKGDASAVFPTLADEKVTAADF